MEFCLLMQNSISTFSTRTRLIYLHNNVVYDDRTCQELKSIKEPLITIISLLLLYSMLNKTTI